MHKGTAEIADGVVQKLHKGTAVTTHTKENNTKDNKTKEEREIDKGEKNLLFQLSENMQEKFTSQYINNLIERQEHIKNETAFTIKIKKQLAKQDKEQLEDFKEWYLITECERLVSKYISDEVALNYKNNDVYIESIYPYFRTTGFVVDNLIYMSFESKEIEPLGFDSVEQLESFIRRNKA
jgi:type III secretory pathway component EscV